MPFRLSSHLFRLMVVLIVLSVVVSTIARLGGPRSESEFQTTLQHLIQTPRAPTQKVACDAEVEQRMFEIYGLIGCVAAEQYGTYAELVFEMFYETEEFRQVVKRDGTMKVVPILLKAVTDPEAFKLIAVEYRLRNTLGAALTGIGRSIIAGKDAIPALKEETIKIQEASRPFQPQEFAFLLLYAMLNEGGGFLDQFHVLAIDRVETIYSQHSIHLMSSLLTSGIMAAETKYRFDQENFNWVRDGGNAALDAALLTVPFMGRWVVKGATTTKVARVAKVSKVATGTKIARTAKVTGITITVGAVGYGITHPVQSLLAVNATGTRFMEFLKIPLASLFGPFLGWLVVLSILTCLFWPITVSLYIIYRSGGRLTRAVVAVGAWLFPKNKLVQEKS